jgi:DNA-binding LytR/AlgR family response regulator
MDDKRFLRCHQSYLVNMDYIVDDKGEFVLRDGTHIPIRVRTRKGDIEKYRRYYLSKF